MSQVNIFIFLLFLSWIRIAISLAPNSGDSYVRDACSVTRYQDLCIHSLASFSNTAKNSPSIWARAGVSVTIGEAKNASQYLNKLKKDRVINGIKNRIALSDCIECLDATVDNLHKSLGELRKLDPIQFDVQIGDVTTWLSAALTDEDTCLDGFDDSKTRSSRQIALVRNKVSRLTYITSNALALVNKLASAGLGNFTN